MNKKIEFVKNRDTGHFGKLSIEIEDCTITVYSRFRYYSDGSFQTQKYFTQKKAYDAFLKEVGKAVLDGWIY